MVRGWLEATDPFLANNNVMGTKSKQAYLRRDKLVPRESS